MTWGRKGCSDGRLVALSNECHDDDDDDDQHADAGGV